MKEEELSEEDRWAFPIYRNLFDEFEEHAEDVDGIRFWVEW